MTDDTQALQIYNTLTRNKEALKTLEPGYVRMYVCGPTVYDDCHLGHARSFVTFDVVARYLRSLGYDVTYARNITDIDDKITARAHEHHEPPGVIAKRFTERMHEDCSALGMLAPDMEPRAHQHIRGMIVMIEELIQNGFAYASAGSVYFDIAKFETYGALSGRRIEELRAGTRKDIEADKRNPLDFTLWKPGKAGDRTWSSPWGEGRPGWHIECSAMAAACLGNQFDIHGGGMDLKFPHHENEIAQSEAANGQRFASMWMHSGLVQSNGRKMAKSDGNYVTVRSLLERYSGETVRFFLLSSHYRSPINYSEKGLRQADNALRRLYMALREHERGEDAPDEAWRRRFAIAMNDDFNTPHAIGIMFDLAHALNTASRTRTDDGEPKRLGATLRALGAPLGVLQEDAERWLKNAQGEDAMKEEEIRAMIDERVKARGRRNWAEADRIRNTLTGAGIVIEDNPHRTRWHRSR